MGVWRVNTDAEKLLLAVQARLMHRAGCLGCAGTVGMAEHDMPPLLSLQHFTARLRLQSPACACTELRHCFVSEPACVAQPAFMNGFSCRLGLYIMQALTARQPQRQPARHPLDQVGFAAC